MQRDRERIDTFRIEHLLELSREEEDCQLGQTVANERRISKLVILHLRVEASQRIEPDTGRWKCVSGC